MQQKMTSDPIELEILRNLFEAAAEEMGITLARVAFSANIKERRDFSCALFLPDGQLLAQAAHIPVHLGSMPASVAAVRERLGKLDEGDVAIVNDPFAGGTHLPDITLVSPIYYATDLVGYAANRAHHADVGGTSPGSMTLSRHIDEEGLRLEPTLLYRRGVRDEALIARILAAVRTPDERLGDLDAQLAANAVGAKAMLRMVAARGCAVVLDYGHALLEYSAAFMRRAIDAIPQGIYRFEDALDGDGVGSGAIRIALSLTVESGTVIADFSQSADQVPGCVNCPEAVTRSAVYYCFACLLEPGVALNGGSFRDIDIRARPGSVLAAQYPAAVVAGNTETSQRVVDVVFGALAQALPDRIPAASCGTMSSLALGGIDESGKAWTYYETIGGGGGGGPLGPGASAIQCHMTNTLNTPAEAIELQYPLRIRRFETAAATGGADTEDQSLSSSSQLGSMGCGTPLSVTPGRPSPREAEYRTPWHPQDANAHQPNDRSSEKSVAHRGGDGTVRELEILSPCEGTLLADRRSSRPYGLAGGMAGACGIDCILHPDGTTTPLAGKARFKLRPGDRLHIRTPGGGGWGR